jgi:hypothetical protein
MDQGMSQRGEQHEAERMVWKAGVYAIYIA